MLLFKMFGAVGSMQGLGFGVLSVLFRAASGVHIYIYTWVVQAHLGRHGPFHSPPCGPHHGERALRCRTHMFEGHISSHFESLPEANFFGP